MASVRPFMTALAEYQQTALFGLDGPDGLLPGVDAGDGLGRCRGSRRRRRRTQKKKGKKGEEEAGPRGRSPGRGAAAHGARAGAARSRARTTSSSRPLGPLPCRPRRPPSIRSRPPPPPRPFAAAPPPRSAADAFPFPPPPAPAAASLPLGHRAGRGSASPARAPARAPSRSLRRTRARARLPGRPARCLRLRGSAHGGLLAAAGGGSLRRGRRAGRGDPDDDIPARRPAWPRFPRSCSGAPPVPARVRCLRRALGPSAHPGVAAPSGGHGPCPRRRLPRARAPSP